MGADIPDSTLVDWCGRAMKVLQPLIERIEADIMASDVLHATTPQSVFWIDPCATKGWARA
nr:IS66 family transposase [Roseicitreum antarcticum]